MRNSSRSQLLSLVSTTSGIARQQTKSNMRKFVCYLVLCVCVMLSAGAQLPQHDSFRLLNNKYYDIIYSDCLRIPCSSKYYFSGTCTAKKLKRQAFSFVQDKRVPKPRPRTSDYTNSGYVRGHMVPSADMAFAKDAMKATFLMSNVAPMRQEFNNGVWKQIENQVRLAARKFYRIVILSGVTFGKCESITRISGDIAVPDGFWKVIYQPEQKKVIRAWYVIQERSTSDESSVRCPLDTIIKYAYIWPYHVESETTTH